MLIKWNNYKRDLQQLGSGVDPNSLFQPCISVEFVVGAEANLATKLRELANYYMT